MFEILRVIKDEIAYKLSTIFVIFFTYKFHQWNLFSSNLILIHLFRKSIVYCWRPSMYCRNEENQLLFWGIFCRFFVAIDMQFCCLFWARDEAIEAYCVPFQAQYMLIALVVCKTSDYRLLAPLFRRTVSMSYSIVFYQHWLERFQVEKLGAALMYLYENTQLTAYSFN